MTSMDWSAWRYATAFIRRNRLSPAIPCLRSDVWMQDDSEQEWLLSSLRQSGSCPAKEPDRPLPRVDRPMPLFRHPRSPLPADRPAPYITGAGSIRLADATLAKVRGAPRTPHYHAYRCHCWGVGGGLSIEDGIGGQGSGWAGSVGSGQCSLVHLLTSSIRGTHAPAGGRLGSLRAFPKPLPSV